MKLLIVLSLCSLAVAFQYEMPQQWNLWKSQHGKAYKSDKEDLERHLNWVSNKKYIDMHNANADVFGFTLAMNHFGDLSEGEHFELYASSYKTEENYTSSEQEVRLFRPDPFASYTSSIDWRTRNAVTDVKNQGQCGSSYAFSSTGSLEGAHALSHGKMVSLSEQNIIDCSVAYGNYGCRGGNMYNSFRYIVANDGIDTQESYPSTEYQSSCRYNRDTRGSTASGLIYISSGNEDHLETAVAYNGPISVAIDARSKAFLYYSDGVYESTSCSSSTLTHAMLVIGYGTTDDGCDYWIVKNSWGTHWGRKGYILMSKGKYNQCGIATNACFPTL